MLAPGSQRLAAACPAETCTAINIDTARLDKPKAFVALHPEERPSPELGEQLKQLVRDALAPFKAPRQVVFIDALPRSDRGKVLKGQLRE